MNPVESYQHQQQSYQQYQAPYNYNQPQIEQAAQYHVPYQQPIQHYVQPESNYQQQAFNPPTAEQEVWNISQNKASYVVSIAGSIVRR